MEVQVTQHGTSLTRAVLQPAWTGFIWWFRRCKLPIFTQTVHMAVQNQNPVPTELHHFSVQFWGYQSISPKRPGKNRRYFHGCSNQSPAPSVLGCWWVLSSCHYSNTYRSTDCARGQEISRSEVAPVDRMMSQLLFHGPVHVLEEGGRGG